MSKLPMLPLYPDALISDTTHLSTKEFGAYVLLLLATWRNNGEPFADDDKRLARMCRLSAKEWLRIRPALEPFFDLSNHLWVQKRLQKEWVNSLLMRDKKSASGRASALKRHNSHSTNAPTNGVTKRQQPSPSPSLLLPSSEEDSIEESSTLLTPLGAPNGALAGGRCDHDEMIKIWQASSLPPIRKLTPQRRQKLSARLRDELGGSIEEWRGVVSRISASPFLCGNPGPWRADLDWVLEPRHLIRILEGRYDVKANGNGASNGEFSKRRTPSGPAPTLSQIRERENAELRLVE
jgi:uncharacterized protein YdaU (DUF1376 family)